MDLEQEPFDPTPVDQEHKRLIDLWLLFFCSVIGFICVTWLLG